MIDAKFKRAYKISNKFSVNFMFRWPCILVQLWVNDQLNAQLRYIVVYTGFIITILYMFRTTLYSSSGSRIVLIRYTRCCINPL